MFEPIQPIIKLTANRNNLARQLGAAQVVHTTREVITAEYPKISQYIKVRSFKDSTIYIYSTSAAVSQELFYKQKDLLKKINEKFGTELVKKLNLTLNNNSLD